MIQDSDKLSEFPEQFNKLEAEVKKLASNTSGIKWAAWVTAISTAILALAVAMPFLNSVADSFQNYVNKLVQ